MDSEAYRIEKGSRLFFGAPACPMSEIMSDAISQCVAQVDGIAEAHLPQCYIAGDKEARQVLVLGLLRQNDMDRICGELADKLRLVLPEGKFMDMLPFVVDELPVEVRQANCRINKKKRSWWKFW